MVIDADNVSFWDEKYKKGETRWDLKGPNPAFLEVINNEKIIKPCKILIPGSGKGHDAVAAAKIGFEVTALDFSEYAINISKDIAEKENVKINFICEDIFNLDNSYDNSFEAIYDYTMFCAINPERRIEYAEKISSLLKKHGKFIALFFPLEEREGGPPFSVDLIDTYKIFSKHLKLFLSSKKINSHPRRTGREALQVYIKY